MRTAHEMVKKIKDGSLTEADLEAYGEKLCQRAVEEALRTMPQIVDHITKQAIFMRRKAKDFYDKYPEFVEDKELVMATLEQVEIENPGVSYEALVDDFLPERMRVAKELKLRNKDKAFKPGLKDLDSDLGEL